MPNPAATTTDRLSLTLPDWRAALKRRVRRPRKPDQFSALALGLTAINSVDALGYLLTHSAAPGCIHLALAAMYWKAYHSARSGQWGVAWVLVVLATPVAVISLFVS